MKERKPRIGRNPHTGEAIQIEAGRRIAQLIFMAMESEPDAPYGSPAAGSHYQGQTGTTRARS